MNEDIEDLIGRVRRRLGDRDAERTLAEVRDHLSAAAEQLQASGLGRSEAEAIAIRRFGSEEYVHAWVEGDIREEIEMNRPSLGIVAAATIVAGAALGTSAALDSYGSNHAAPVRAALATAVLAIGLVAAHKSLLGRISLAGWAMAFVCVAGVAASFDRDGVGFGIASSIVAVGAAYAGLAIRLASARAIPRLIAVGLSLPVVAGGLRIAWYAGGSEGLLAASAVLLAAFAGSLAWLAYRLLPYEIVVHFHPTARPEVQAVPES